MTIDAASMQDRLLGTTDAMEWAKGLAAVLEPPGDARDDLPGLLVGWFANAMETAEKLSATRKGRAEAIAEARSALDRSDEIRATVIRSRHRGWNHRLLGASDLMADGDSVLSRAIVLDVAREIGETFQTRTTVA